MPFDVRPLDLPGLLLVEPKTFRDARGHFRELFQAEAFRAAGLPSAFVQDNCSRSGRGVLRGLHYQRDPAAQGKLVMALTGRIYDVVVDLRRGSPAYGRWLGVTLDAADARMLYVPPGFAHGFCVPEGEADVLYKVTAGYAPALEGGVLWNDPDLAIDWPVKAPVLAPKDAALPRFRDADPGFTYAP